MSDNMTIKLLSTQIPTYWELIKYAASRAVELDERDLQSALVWLLHELLADKAQCWVRIDDERNIIAVVVTRLEIDKRVNRKALCIYVTFSYRHMPFEQWAQDFELLKEFAREEKCDTITLATKNPQLMEVDKALGFKEAYHHFTYDLKE